LVLPRYQLKLEYLLELVLKYIFLQFYDSMQTSFDQKDLNLILVFKLQSNLILSSTTYFLSKDYDIMNP
jgi:hypothetical protein